MTCWILVKMEVVFQDKIVIKISAILCQDLTRLLSLLFFWLALPTEKKRKSAFSGFRAHMEYDRIRHLRIQVPGRLF